MARCRRIPRLITFDGPPRFFIESECGYGKDAGPPLHVSMGAWKQRNAKLLAELAEPDPVARKKPSACRPTMDEFRTVVDAVWQRIVGEQLERPPEAA